jgi:hypothetical protein
VLGNFISNYYSLISSILLILVLASIFFVYVILKITSKYGKQITLFAGFAIPILIIIILAIFIAIAPFAVPVVTIFLLPAIVFLLVIILRRERLILAGEIVCLSAKAILYEKEMLLVSFLSGLFVYITSIFDLLVIAYFFNFFISSDPISAYSLAFLIFFASAWVIYSFSFYFDSIIIAITDDWYRNPSEDAANIKKGMKRAWDMIGPVVLLGFIFAILDALSRLTRLAQTRIKVRGTGDMMFLVLVLISRIIVSIAKGIIEFITFFSLPCIIIERKGLMEDIKRSAKLVWRHFLDVLLAYTAVNWAYGLLILLSFSLFGISGLATGYFLVYYYLPFDRLTSALLTILIFLVIGFIPSFIMIRPLYTVYKTFLFEFALDRESNFVLPARLPEHIKTRFSQIIQERGLSSKRIFLRPPE